MLHKSYIPPELPRFQKHGAGSAVDGGFSGSGSHTEHGASAAPVRPIPAALTACAGPGKALAPQHRTAAAATAGMWPTETSLLSPEASRFLLFTLLSDLHK